MKFLLMTISLILSACSLDKVQSQTSAAGDHFDANHCEAFVDKAISTSSSHAYKEMHIFIKTLNDRLDGKPTKAGFRYKAVDVSNVCRDMPNNQNCLGLGVWQERSAISFFGDDYFKLNLFLGSDYNPTLRYEGAFFVQTDKGTTYWLKDGNRKDFVVDSGLYGRLGQAYYNHGFPYTSYGLYDLGRLPKTADFFSDLNPNACR